ncbi:hypothetical protein PsYK624_049810 [Phanerochaete sordida]|uniref:Uncharacterized protein n=1 Tax=Phanerochaete sordida TaxID=48140 RepID=A0A9P3G7K3_9APHY|nr:hypothetical protein PsYK624_049810 [Phanerochaete sordida]
MQLFLTFVPLAVFLLTGTEGLAAQTPSTALPTPSGSCKAGSFACSGHTILVCNSTGQFVTAANCGSQNCTISGGSVFCS